MDNDQKTEVKGRYSWVIYVLELFIGIAYLVIGFSGISHGMQKMDFVGIFEAFYTAILFLIFATVVTTALCFLPPFKSKGNMYIAVWNIVWLGFSVYALWG